MYSRNPRDVMSRPIGAAGAGNDRAGFLAMIGNDDAIGRNFHTQAPAAVQVSSWSRGRTGALPCPRS